MKSHHKLEKLKSHIYIALLLFVYDIKVGINVDGWYFCKFFFEAYKRLVYLLFFKQARKKSWIRSIFFS